MKSLLPIACLIVFALACNNATTEPKEQTQDTSASSSADSTLIKALEKLKADSAMRDSSGINKDSLKK